MIIYLNDLRPYMALCLKKTSCVGVYGYLMMLTSVGVGDVLGSIDYVGRLWGRWLYTVGSGSGPIRVSNWLRWNR